VHRESRLDVPSFRRWCRAAARTGALEAARAGRTGAPNEQVRAAASGRAAGRARRVPAR